MRYLVRARVKPGREADLLKAIESETLGQGSVAGGEYLRNMQDARLCADQTARWVEVCYCPTPLQEERPYWEQYFDLTRVQMRTTAVNAATRTALSPGRAVTATARRASRRSCNAPANPSCARSAQKEKKEIRPLLNNVTNG